MGLNIGVCPDKEKNSKKEVILDYLMKHVKVSDFELKTAIVIPGISCLQKKYIGSIKNSHARTTKLFYRLKSAIMWFCKRAFTQKKFRLLHFQKKKNLSGWFLLLDSKSPQKVDFVMNGLATWQHVFTT